TNARPVGDLNYPGYSGLGPHGGAIAQPDYPTPAKAGNPGLIRPKFQSTSVAAKIFDLTRQVDRRIRQIRSLALAATAADLRAHHDLLVGHRFVSSTGWAHLRHIPRYLEGIGIRLDTLDAGGALQRDGLNMQTVQALENDYTTLMDRAPAGVPVPRAITDIFWQLQELRVSLFAQQLGTATRVSEKRVRQAIGAAEAQLS